MPTARLLLPVLVLSLAPLLRAGEGDLLKVGERVPTFSAVTVEGQPWLSSSLAGRVAVLNFFATWCGPCMKEMPLIEKELWLPLRDKGLAVVAFGREHKPAEIAAFVRQKGFTFTVLADPGRAAYGKFAEKFIPRCYLVGRDGVIRAAITGASPADFSAFKAAVAAALAEKG